jgi:phage terminase small subunit
MGNAMSAERLTGKQQLFIAEYLNCLNGAEAARLAGYSGSNETLAAVGYENLRKPHIAAEIERIMQDKIMSASEVLMHLTDIGRGDMDDVVDANGNVDLKKAREKRKTRLIKTIRQRTITTSSEDGEGSDIYETRIEMYDRIKALTLLAKYHDLVNHIKVDDWRTELLQLLREGKVTWEQVEAELGNDLSREFFEQAGVPVAHARKGGTP